MGAAEPSLTPLETHALAMFADLYGDDFPGLAAQFAAVRVKTRENTRGGFFTHVDVVDPALAIPAIPSPLDKIEVRPEGMLTNLELLLFFKAGLLVLIEGYAIEGEDTKPVDFDRGAFSYMGLRYPPRRQQS